MARRLGVSLYNFFGIAPMWLGVSHAEDLPFVFGNAFITGVQFYKNEIAT